MDWLIYTNQTLVPFHSSSFSISARVQSQAIGPIS
uniref:Uncharacterized protein n=1 Tax=Arundo donax TaxID=35708 RepID=A0A0A9CAR9_ARUDO